MLCSTCVEAISYEPPAQLWSLAMDQCFPRALGLRQSNVCDRLHCRARHRTRMRQRSALRCPGASAPCATASRRAEQPTAPRRRGSRCGGSFSRGPAGCRWSPCCPGNQTDSDRQSHCRSSASTMQVLASSRAEVSDANPFCQPAR